MAASKRRKAAGGSAVTLDNFLADLDKNLAIAADDPSKLPGHAASERGNPIQLGPRIAEADDWAAKQLAGAAAAGERWLARVQAPKKNPKEEALKANTRYKTAVQKAVTEDRFAKGVQKIDLDEMMETIRAGGSGQFTTGVARREGKIKRVVGELRADVLALTATLDKMPVDTSEQREAKMIAAKRGMELIGKKRRGG